MVLFFLCFCQDLLKTAQVDAAVNTQQRASVDPVSLFCLFFYFPKNCSFPILLL